MSYLPPGIQIVLILLVAAAAIYDLRSRRLPNWLTAGGFVAGLGLCSFLFGMPGFWFSLKGAGLALLFYFPLFALRAMGAGDAKLMAAVGSLAGPWNWLGIFFLTAILGGILAIILTVSRGAFRRTLANMLFVLKQLASFQAPFSGRPELDASHTSALTLPHACSVAFGSIGFLAAAWFLAPR